MVGILVSFWEGLFSGAMLVSGRVHLQLKLATNWNHRRLCWFQSIRTSLPPLLEWATAISSCLIWIDPSKVLPSLVLNWVSAILGIKNHYIWMNSIFRMLCSKATKTKCAEFSKKVENSPLSFLHVRQVVSFCGLHLELTMGFLDSNIWKAKKNFEEHHLN